MMRLEKKKQLNLLDVENSWILEWVAQGCGGSPVPEDIPSQAGPGREQPDWAVVSLYIVKEWD